MPTTNARNAPFLEHCLPVLIPRTWIPNTKDFSFSGVKCPVFGDCSWASRMKGCPLDERSLPSCQNVVTWFQFRELAKMVGIVQECPRFLCAAGVLYFFLKNNARSGHMPHQLEAESGKLHWIFNQFNAISSMKRPILMKRLLPRQHSAGLYCRLVMEFVTLQSTKQKCRRTANHIVLIIEQVMKLQSLRSILLRNVFDFGPSAKKYY